MSTLPARSAVTGGGSLKTSLALPEPAFETWLVYICPKGQERVMIDARKYVRAVTGRDVLLDFAHLKDRYDLMVIPDDGVRTVR